MNPELWFNWTLDWFFRIWIFGSYKLLDFGRSLILSIDIAKILSTCNVDKSTSAPFQHFSFYTTFRKSTNGYYRISTNDITIP
jgi:hypothetical protein